jgi:hypothetical protein
MRRKEEAVFGSAKRQQSFHNCSWKNSAENFAGKKLIIQTETLLHK